MIADPRTNGPSFGYVPRSIPSKMNVQTRYSDHFAYAVAAGAYTEYMYRGNSLYDPDAEVGGHQSRLFDQLIALYKYACVRASKITVMYISNSTTAVNVSIFPTTLDAPGFADADTACEQPRSLTRMIPGYVRTSEVMSVQARTKQMFDGYFDGYLQFSHDNSGNPSSQWYWCIALSSPMGAAADAHLQIAVDYDVMFFTPKSVGAS